MELEGQLRHSISIFGLPFKRPTKSQFLKKRGSSFSNLFPKTHSYRTMDNVANGNMLQQDQYVQAVRWKLQSYHTEFVHCYDPPKIVLPVLFSMDLFDNISNTVTLIDPVGNRFEVLVTKHKTIVVLTQGTERIGHYYKLFQGGWLTFIYIDEKTLIMEERDRLGEHVVYPTPPKSFYLGDMSNPIRIDDDKVSEAPVSNAKLLEGGFHHSLVKSLSVADANTDVMNMVAAFVKLATNRSSDKLNIVDEIGKVWTLKLLWDDTDASKCLLTSGWLKFCKAKGLKAGTSICFGVRKDAANHLFFKFV